MEFQPLRGRNPEWWENPGAPQPKRLRQQPPAQLGPSGSRLQPSVHVAAQPCNGNSAISTFDSVAMAVAAPGQRGSAC